MQADVLGPDDAPDLALLHGGIGTVGVAIAEHDGFDEWRSRFDPDVLAETYPMWARQLSTMHRDLGGEDARRDVCRRDASGLAVDVDVDALAAPDTPVLLVRGARDPVVDPAQYTTRAALPQADEAVIPAGEHGVQLTRGPLVGVVLQGFDDRVVDGGR